MLLVPFSTQSSGLCYAEFKWHIYFAVCQEIVQFGDPETRILEIKDALRAAGQPFVQAVIAGALKLHIVISADAIVHRGSSNRSFRDKCGWSLYRSYFAPAQ